MSQPDNNGGQLSAGDMTESDSELSGKEDEDIDEDPPETPYFPNEEEELDDVNIIC